MAVLCRTAHQDRGCAALMVQLCPLQLAPPDVWLNGINSLDAELAQVCQPWLLHAAAMAWQFNWHHLQPTNSAAALLGYFTSACLRM